MTRLEGFTVVPSNEELHAMMNGISGGEFPSLSLVNDVEGGRRNMTWQYKLLRDIALGERRLIDADGNGFEPLPVPKYSIHGPTQYVEVVREVEVPIVKLPALPTVLRKRKKRYSVPTDPIEAAEYLALRTSTAWRQALVDELEESICDGLKLEDTFEYGYE